jgi:hypothetical protein
MMYVKPIPLPKLEGIGSSTSTTFHVFASTSMSPEGVEEYFKAPGELGWILMLKSVVFTKRILSPGRTLTLTGTGHTQFAGLLEHGGVTMLSAMETV